MTKREIVTVELCCQLLGLLPVIYFPIKYLWRTGNFLGSALRMWFWIFLWVLVMAVMLPMTAYEIFSTREMALDYPDSPGIPLLVIFGWFPAVAICAILWMVRTLVKRKKEP